MNGDILTTLMELGSTGFIQMLLGLIIWILIPKVQSINEESLKQQRADFKEALDKIEENRLRIEDDVAEAVSSLETDIEKLDDSIKAFAGVYVSTQMQDAKKSQILMDRIIEPEEDDDDPRRSSKRGDD